MVIDISTSDCYKLVNVHHLTNDFNTRDIMPDLTVKKDDHFGKICNFKS